jgi:hypothetical protein
LALSGALTTSSTIDGRDVAADGTRLANTSGTNTGDQTITLTGDVTGTGTGSFATTIEANAVETGMILDSNVTLAKIEDIATNSILGRDTTGTGVPEVLSAATARSVIDVDQAGTDNSTPVTFGSSVYDYATLVGQEITLAAIDLTTDVTGDLPVADGGTGASDAGTARTNLGIVQGGPGTDTTAIHDDIAAEISVLTEKASPVSGDHLIIEDSAAGNVKKRVQIGNLPAGGETNNLEVDGAADIALNEVPVGSGTGTVVYQTIPTAAITDDAVTYDKMQNVVADERLLGNVAGAGGIVAELDQLTVLTFLGGTTGTSTLVRSASPTIVTPTIASMTNAQHDHADAAGGGVLNLSDINPDAELDMGAHSVGFTLDEYTDDTADQIDLDMRAGNQKKLNLTANTTVDFSNNPANPGAFHLIIEQDATGTRTITWPSTGDVIMWAGGAAPTLSTAANSVDIISLVWDGTNYHGASVLDFKAV